MDWRAVRFDWNRARAFLVTAEEGSFSAAARALATTQPTIGRQVAALEEELDVALFERIGNRLELTPAGLELLDHARAMSQAAMQVSLVATGQSTSLEGSVCISASQLITAHLLPPAVGRLRQDHPGIEIELVASNTASDLRRREADIAVRNFQPQQAELFARRVGTSTARLYASPAYIERLGHPATPADLSKAELFAFDRSDLMIKGLSSMGMELTTDNFPVITGDHLVQWELCKRGLGICIVMEEVGDAEPAVQQVLPELPGIPVPLWLTAHRELRTSRRIRVVFDVLAEVLGAACAS